MPLGQCNGDTVLSLSPHSDSVHAPWSMLSLSPHSGVDAPLVNAVFESSQ